MVSSPDGMAVMPVGMANTALASVKTDAFAVVLQSEFTAPGELSRVRPLCLGTSLTNLPIFASVSCHRPDKLLSPSRS